MRVPPILALATALLVGCGGGDDSSPERGDASSPTEALPPIVVKSPGVGETVSSPVTISGSANVFEATVSISIFDASGNEIVRTFTTATCGTGCRGRYSEAVRFEVDETQAGVIQLYESSAEDRSKLFPVEIPVILKS